MKIYIASDHGGYYLKEELKNYLSSKGYSVTDMGNSKFDKNDDYTDFIFPLSEKVAKDKGSMGIVLGRSGNGEAIAANKVKGIRAALCLSERHAKKARDNNDANTLCLGADFISSTTAKKIVDTFLKTRFSRAKRHNRRVSKIKKYESTHFK